LVFEPKISRHVSRRALTARPIVQRALGLSAGSLTGIRAALLAILAWFALSALTTSAARADDDAQTAGSSSSGLDEPTTGPGSSFDFASPDGSFECRVNSGPWSGCDWPNHYPALPDDTSVLYVRPASIPSSTNTNQTLDSDYGLTWHGYAASGPGGLIYLGTNRADQVYNGDGNIVGHRSGLTPLSHENYNTLDTQLNIANDAGLKVILRVHDPDVSLANEDTSEWAQIFDHLGQHLSGNDTYKNEVIGVQVWNEPNGAISPTAPATYANYLKIAYNSFHSGWSGSVADPPVVSAGLVSRDTNWSTDCGQEAPVDTGQAKYLICVLDWLNSNDCSGTCLDAVGVHPYPAGWTGTSGGSAWGGSNCNGGRCAFNRVYDIQSILNANIYFAGHWHDTAGFTQPLWATEIGISSKGIGETGQKNGLNQIFANSALPSMVELGMVYHLIDLDTVLSNCTDGQNGQIDNCEADKFGVRKSDALDAAHGGGGTAKAAYGDNGLRGIWPDNP
jgi:hypothetical protein